MILELRAIDFKWTKFGNPRKCGIAKAAKREFNTNKVLELYDTLDIDDTRYKHIFYCSEEFILDRKQAGNAKFSPDTIIREIELIKIN